MATTYKVLGQVHSTAGANTDLYTVPSATSAVCSTLSVCNLGVTTTYRVAVRVAGAAIEDKQFIIHDAIINADDSALLTLGITLAATDVVTVQASTADVSFNLFGSEIT
jgi:hypothetical protein